MPPYIYKRELYTLLFQNKCQEDEEEFFKHMANLFGCTEEEARLSLKVALAMGCEDSGENK
jgi:hypothetical protein